MAEISSLPSIPIQSASEDASALPADMPKRQWAERLWGGFWKLISLIHLYWDLLSYVPLDIYLSAIFTNRAGPEGSMSIDDRLDLHPSLPLLVVSAKVGPDIRFYNTETSEHVWTLQIKLPRHTQNGRAVRSGITCLKFSKGNHLAVGLSDGTVRFIEQDFAAMIKSPPTPQTAKPTNSELVTLLPVSSSRINADLLGSITNLVFSPSSGMPGDEIWLTVATEKTGIWIWSPRMGKAIRAVNTAGINEACLHWVSVVQEQNPKPTSRKQLPISNWRRWSSFFEGVDDSSLTDGYFAPSPARANFPVVVNWSAPPYDDWRPNGSSIGVFGGPSLEADKDTHVGESFLVFGTKKGSLHIQRLWHSSIMMVRETSVKLSPTAFAQSNQRFAHRFGPASGEISHLVMQSPNITTSKARLTVFMACKNDGDCSIPVHQFSVSLPFKEPLEKWCGWVPELGIGVLRSLVNFLLAGTNYRWLSRNIWPSGGDHLLVQHDNRQASTVSAVIQQNAALTSASALATTPFLLTTTHVKGSRRFDRVAGDKCILRSYNPYTPSLPAKCIITPLLPIADQVSPPSPSPLGESPTPGRNYYTAMMAQSGVTESTQKRRRPAGGYAMHAYDCGRVAWGQQKYGEAVGGFFYQPASLFDSSVAVGLFKVKY